jgi:hypothetical protein
MHDHRRTGVQAQQGAQPPTITEAKTQARGQTSDTGWEWAHLDMTRSHGRPCLGGPHRPQRQALWDGAPRPADDARTWRQQQTGPRRGAVSIAISIATWRRLRHHLQDQQGTPTGGGGRRGSGAPFLLVFSLSSFLPLSYTPGPSLGV